MSAPRWVVTLERNAARAGSGSPATNAASQRVRQACGWSVYWDRRRASVAAIAAGILKSTSELIVIMGSRSKVSHKQKKLAPTCGSELACEKPAATPLPGAWLTGSRRADARSSMRGREAVLVQQGHAAQIPISDIVHRRFTDQPTTAVLPRRGLERDATWSQARTVPAVHTEVARCEARFTS